MVFYLPAEQLPVWKQLQQSVYDAIGELRRHSGGYSHRQSGPPHNSPEPRPYVVPGDMGTMVNFLKGVGGHPNIITLDYSGSNTSGYDVTTCTVPTTIAAEIQTQRNNGSRQRDWMSPGIAWAG